MLCQINAIELQLQSICIQSCLPTVQLDETVDVTLYHITTYAILTKKVIVISLTEYIIKMSDGNNTKEKAMTFQEAINHFPRKVAIFNAALDNAKCEVFEASGKDATLRAIDNAMDDLCSIHEHFTPEQVDELEQELFDSLNSVD